MPDVARKMCINYLQDIHLISLLGKDGEDGVISNNISVANCVMLPV